MNISRRLFLKRASAVVAVPSALGALFLAPKPKPKPEAVAPAPYRPVYRIRYEDPVLLNDYRAFSHPEPDIPVEAKRGMRPAVMCLSMPDDDSLVRHTPMAACDYRPARGGSRLDFRAAAP